MSSLRCYGLSLVALFAGYANCSFSTTELLNAQFLDVQKSPPDLLHPPDGFVVDDAPNSTINLSWTGRIGALSYEVELVTVKSNSESIGSLFSNSENHIEGSPFKVKAPDTSLNVRLSDAFTYMWRVRSDVSAPGVYSSINEIHAFDGSIYVYCPGLVTECSEDTDGSGETNTLGNKTSPFRTLQAGITDSAGRKLPVKVAHRGDNASYNESIAVTPGAVVLGGYEAIDWSKTQTLTRIESEAVTAVSINSVSGQETSLQGFEIENLSEQTNSKTIRIQDSDESLTISNNTIIAPGIEGGSACLSLENSSPTINGNLLFSRAGGASGVILVELTNSPSTISENTFLNFVPGGGGGHARAISMIGSNAVIERNTILRGTDAHVGFAYTIYMASSSPVIRDNTIEITSSSSCIGVYSPADSYPRIERNKIASIDECSAISMGINSSPLIVSNVVTGGITLSSSAGSAIIINNIIGYGQGGAGGQRMTINSRGQGTVIHNNLIAGPPDVGNSYTYFGNNNRADILIRNKHLIGRGSTTGNGVYLADMFGHTVVNSLILGESDITINAIAIDDSGNHSLDANILGIGGGGARTIINELDNFDPFSVRSNFSFDFGVGGSFSFYYDDDFSTSLTSICTGGNYDTDGGACDGVFLNTPTGLLNQTDTGGGFSDVFAYYPNDFVFSSDGPDANTDYDGTVSSIELLDASTCGLFNIGEYFEYFSDGIPRLIEATDCASDMIIEFSPDLEVDFGPGVPIFLWGGASSDYNKKYALQSSATGLASGLACPDDYEVRTFVWMASVSESECDTGLPFSHSYFSGSSCDTDYLYPASELTGNGNGLCEAGEDCLINPNIGSYAGHGYLIESSCDISALLDGINLFEYDSNGY